MRALWTAGGSAVLGSALLGVLVGMAIHGVSADDPVSRTPGSTWVGSTSSTPPSTTEISTTVSSAPPSTSSTAPSTQQPPKRTTPPPAVTNQEQPPPPQPTATTTTAPSSSGWPCNPLNPLPPPTCKNMG